MNYRSSIVQTKGEYFVFVAFYLLFWSGTSVPNLNASFQLKIDVSMFSMQVPPAIFIEVNLLIELWQVITQAYSMCAI